MTFLFSKKILLFFQDFQNDGVTFPNIEFQYACFKFA